LAYGVLRQKEPSKKEKKKKNERDRELVTAGTFFFSSFSSSAHHAGPFFFISSFFLSLFYFVLILVSRVFLVDILTHTHRGTLERKILPNQSSLLYFVKRTDLKKTKQKTIGLICCVLF
jgi:hypothetical protein